jgi:hydrogenase expression/formation protein HypE
MKYLPVGKLPIDLLKKVLPQETDLDPRVLLGPGIGLDCAVVEIGPVIMVLKSDPITFATDEIGWYAVQVNANDIATTGAIPRWMLITLLLPDNLSTANLVDTITSQVYEACRDIGVSVIGGHTEITYDLPRPILVATMIGEGEKDRLITPRGANPGDKILLTKGVPIEATAIIARQLSQSLDTILSVEEIKTASDYLYNPGISVLRDAQTAMKAGRITAMHDPTEGGLASALWELAEASGKSLHVKPEYVSIPQISARICKALNLNPLAAIASGSLLMTVNPNDAYRVCQALEWEGIPCVEIGQVEDGPAIVWQTVESGEELLPRPDRDEIAILFED